MMRCSSSTSSHWSVRLYVQAHLSSFHFEISITYPPVLFIYTDLEMTSRGGGKVMVGFKNKEIPCHVFTTLALL